jgi:hypothetical protein
MHLSPEYLKFQESEPSRATLLHLLREDQTLNAAIAAVESCARPLHMPQPIPGQAYDITIAHHYHEMLGMNRAFRMLRALCDPRKTGKEKNEPDEFFHALPPEFQ